MSQSQRRKRRAELEEQAARIDSRVKRQRKCMDSTQTHEERAQIRHEYRELAEETQRKHAVLELPQSQDYRDLLEKQDRIHRNVAYTSEAVLDTQQLQVMGKFGEQQAKKLRNARMTISVQDFIAALEEKFSDEEGINWNEIGQSALSHSFSVPSVGFMNGAVGTRMEVKVRSRASPSQRVSRTTDASKTTVPETGEVKNDEKTQTDARVQQLQTILDHQSSVVDSQPRPEEAQAKLTYFDLVLNPKSFTQTVENIFDLSFLVKSGDAMIKTPTSNEDIPQPIVHNSRRPEQDQSVTLKQCVVKLDYPTYLKLIEAYEVPQPMVPTRRIELTQQERELERIRAEQAADSDEEEEEDIDIIQETQL